MDVYFFSVRNDLRQSLEDCCIERIIAVIKFGMNSESDNYRISKAPTLSFLISMFLLIFSNIGTLVADARRTYKLKDNCENNGSIGR